MDFRTLTCPLTECDFVCIENQWGEISLQQLEVVPFNHPLSKVFPRMFDDRTEEDRYTFINEGIRRIGVFRV